MGYSGVYDTEVPQPSTSNTSGAYHALHPRFQVNVGWHSRGADSSQGRDNVIHIARPSKIQGLEAQANIALKFMFWKKSRRSTGESPIHDYTQPTPAGLVRVKRQKPNMQNTPDMRTSQFVSSDALGMIRPTINTTSYN